MAQSALIDTCALTTTEVTPSVPAHRHADFIHISSHAPHTSLRPQVFVRLLTFHPDSKLVSKLIHSLTDSFDIGYHGPRTHLTAPKLVSARQHPEVVDDPQERGRSLKKDGGWRLINHLSAPSRNSINNFIDPTDFSLQYAMPLESANERCDNKETLHLSVPRLTVLESQPQS